MAGTGGEGRPAGGGAPASAGQAVVLLHSAAMKADTGSTVRVFSGIQPSGVVHLGNDLGAIRNYVALQDRYEAIYLSLIHI